MATLTSRNGLPCDTIHGTDVGRPSLVVGIRGVRGVSHRAGPSWTLGSPTRRTGSRRRSGMQRTVCSSGRAPGSYGPFVARSADGKLWFLRFEGVQVIDPHHLSSNALRPPVHVERLTADHTMRWQHLPGGARSVRTCDCRPASVTCRSTTRR